MGEPPGYANRGLNIHHSIFELMINRRFETRSHRATHFIEAYRSINNPGAAEYWVEFRWFGWGLMQYNRPWWQTPFTSPALLIVCNWWGNLPVQVVIFGWKAPLRPAEYHKFQATISCPSLIRSTKEQQNPFLFFSKLAGTFVMTTRRG